MPFRSTRLRRMLGISPDAYPTVTNRPPQRSERSAGSASAPPTGSTTTSLPSGRASRSACRRSPSAWLITMLAPWADATSSFSADDDTGELAPGNERRRHFDLVLVRDDQHVGVVDGRRAHPHPRLPG